MSRVPVASPAGSACPTGTVIPVSRTVAPRRLASVMPPEPVGLRQQQDELLAAVPEREVHPADLLAYPPGEFDQHRVAGRMPVRVVDLLEAVEVHDDHAERVAEAFDRSTRGAAAP